LIHDGVHVSLVFWQEIRLIVILSEESYFNMA
jgi:hypothetical protein